MKKKKGEILYFSTVRSFFFKIGSILHRNVFCKQYLNVLVIIFKFLMLYWLLSLVNLHDTFHEFYQQFHIIQIQSGVLLKETIFTILWNFQKISRYQHLIPLSHLKCHLTKNRNLLTILLANKTNSLVILTVKRTLTFYHL